MKKMYWRIRIVLLALRWVFCFNLGDQVVYGGQVWTLIQGRYHSKWDLVNPNGERSRIDERDLRKARTLKNYTRGFTSGYRFYMTNWYSIWLRSGILPWMRSCNIWARGSRSDGDTG